MTPPDFVGIVGGSGELGGAIAHGLLGSEFITPEQLWISNRSGNTSGFEEGLGIRFTTHNQELVDACQVVLVAVPPHLTSTLNINAENRLVISVMAGVTVGQIEHQTHAQRVVRAMSNPAAGIGLGYSPWCASGVVLAETKASPEEHVRDMIAYEGTTAAGLEAMKASPLATAIEEGLQAAYEKAQRIA